MDGWMDEWMDHSTIKWFGLEGTLRIIWFQPYLPLDQVAQNPVQPGLEHFQRGGSHSFSGQPVPVPHYSHHKEFLCYI